MKPQQPVTSDSGPKGKRNFPFVQEIHFVEVSSDISPGHVLCLVLNYLGSKDSGYFLQSAATPPSTTLLSSEQTVRLLRMDVTNLIFNVWRAYNLTKPYQLVEWIQQQEKCKTHLSRARQIVQTLWQTWRPTRIIFTWTSFPSFSQQGYGWYRCVTVQSEGVVSWPPELQWKNNVYLSRHSCLHNQMMGCRSTRYHNLWAADLQVDLLSAFDCGLRASLNSPDCVAYNLNGLPTVIAIAKRSLETSVASMTSGISRRRRKEIHLDSHLDYLTIYLHRTEDHKRQGSSLRLFESCPFSLVKTTACL
jgi:hypothetical protein